MKKLIKAIFALLNLSVSRIASEKEKEKFKQEAELLALQQLRERDKWLKQLNIKTIIDIGANEGQFVSHIRKVIPNARIISFEPLKEAFQILTQNTIEDKQVECYNYAIGNSNEAQIIYKNDFTQSSSLLKMHDEHKKAFPFTDTEIKQEEINVRTLDSLYSELKIEEPCLVKVDVQGYERNVILGGQEALKKVKIIIIEMSLKEMYEGEALFDEIYNMLIRLGFTFRGVYDQLRSKNNNEIVQCDGIFIRS